MRAWDGLEIEGIHLGAFVGATGMDDTGDVETRDLSTDRSD